MKLSGLVILGIVATSIIAIPIEKLFIVFFPHLKTSDDAYLWVPLFVILPLASFFGSLFTGFFCYYIVENKLTILLLSPGIYLALLLGLENWNWMFILLVLYWYLMSLAGVGLGYFARSLLVRWWYK